MAIICIMKRLETIMLSDRDLIKELVKTKNLAIHPLKFGKY